MLGVLLILLLVLLRSCGGGDDESPRDTASPAASSETEPSASASPTAVPSSPSAAAVPSSPSAAAATPSPRAGPCNPARLSIQAVADRPAYKRPATPRLSLVITNPGPAPCRLDVGPAALELRVISGPDRIWSSDDCTPGGGPQIVTVPPGGTQSSTVAWPLRRSRPGCPEGQAGAEPGTYRVIGRVGTVLRQGTAFRIE